MDTNGINIAFLLCVPRSGSSLTTVMLQNHSKVFAAQEMWFLLSLYDLRQKKSRPYGGTSILDRLYNGVLSDELFDRACRSFALEVYNGLLYSSGADILIDKSPRYYLILEFLDRLFPQSKRIWLVRNPLDIAASYKKVHKHLKEPFDLAHMVSSGRLNMHLADITVGLHRYIHYFSGQSSYSCRVHYEDLTAEPRKQIAELCRFLGLEYEEGMERYGDYVKSGRAAQFFSMGAGDPFLAQHAEPHQQSVNSWQEVLTREEAAMYCRAVGGRVFHELGYSEQLAEAERWFDAKVPLEPDENLMNGITSQLAAAAGYKWEAGYQLKDSEAAAAIISRATAPRQDVEPEVLRLQMMLRTLERRLETIYEERDQYRARYEELRLKTDRIKSMIPFSGPLSRLAFGNSHEGGRK